MNDTTKHFKRFTVNFQIFINLTVIFNNFKSKLNLIISKSEKQVYKKYH